MLKPFFNYIKLYIFALRHITIIGMKRHLLTYIAALTIASCSNNNVETWELRTPDGSPARVVSIDTMEMSNPFVIFDKNRLTYYMTGDGGYIWKSNDLHKWNGPYNVLSLDSLEWMGANPQITAPEIHKFKGKYYYLATFTRQDVTIDNVDGYDIPRRSCQLFVADSIEGPYKPIPAETPLLRADQVARGATFITDEYDSGYLIYSHDWIQSREGTTQIILMTEDLSRQIGEPYIMFQASQNPWSTTKDGVQSQIMDGPWLFDTEERELGMLFTTEIDGKGALGVAYSEKDHGLNGPWHIEPRPLLTGGYGQAMLFNDFDGSLVMMLHKDTIINGVRKPVPQLIEVDNQFAHLKIKGKYNF